MNPLLRLFTNRDFLMILAMVLGLASGEPARYVEELVFPALTIVMTLATLSVGARVWVHPAAMLRPALVGAGLSYLVLTPALLALAHWLVEDPHFFQGFVVVAAVPPAVAIIPFAASFRADAPLALLGTVGGYLAGLVLMPLVMGLFFGTGIVDHSDLLGIILLLIVLPVAAAHYLMKTPLAAPLLRHRGAISNLCFFIIVYTIVGLNRGIFLEHPADLGPVALTAFLSIFGLGGVLAMAAGGLGYPRRLSAVMLGTLKNYGMAAGLALDLFGDRAAVSATVTTFVFIVFVILLGFLERRRRGDALEAGPAGS